MTPLNIFVTMARAFTVLLIIFLALPSIAQQSEKADFHLYLIGDAGELDVNVATYKKFLQQQLSKFDWHASLAQKST